MGGTVVWLGVVAVVDVPLAWAAAPVVLVVLWWGRRLVRLLRGRLHSGNVGPAPARAAPHPLPVPVLPATATRRHRRSRAPLLRKVHVRTPSVHMNVPVVHFTTFFLLTTNQRCRGKVTAVWGKLKKKKYALTYTNLQSRSLVGLITLKKVKIGTFRHLQIEGNKTIFLGDNFTLLGVI